MSPHAVAVPFRTRLPAEWTSGRNWVLTERGVEGLLRLAGDELVLEIRVTEDITTVSDSSGYQKDKKASDVAELAVPLSRIVSTRLRKWWWGPRLTVVTDSMRLFEDVPGAAPGRLDLRIARRDVPMAEMLVNEVQIRLADLSLRRVEGSLEEDFRRLSEGE